MMMRWVLGLVVLVGLPALAGAGAGTQAVTVQCADVCTPTTPCNRACISSGTTTTCGNAGFQCRPPCVSDLYLFASQQTGRRGVLFEELYRRCTVRSDSIETWRDANGCVPDRTICAHHQETYSIFNPAGFLLTCSDCCQTYYHGGDMCGDAPPQCVCQ